MTMTERAMSSDERIAYEDATSFNDWKVSVQTGKGQFYGADFLTHVTHGLIKFGRENGVHLSEPTAP